MYEIQRRQHITDQLTLKTPEGAVAHVLKVDLDPDTLAARYNKAKNAVIRMERLVKGEVPDDAGEAARQYGEAICALLSLLFGEEGTETLLQHYEGRYTEMLEDIYPYILNEVEPKIREASEEKRKRMEALYRTGRRGVK